MSVKAKEYDERTICAFLGNYKMTDVIRASGLSRNTCYKLRSDPDFQQILRERKDMMIEATVEKMRSFLLRDVEVLQAVIENPDTSPQTKVNGIQVMLSQFREWLTMADLIKRVEILEQREKDVSGTF